MSIHRIEKIERYSGMFRALSNPSRLAILLRLADCCGSEEVCSSDCGIGACVGELAEGLGLAASTVSRHLKELRRTGLISMTKRGQRVECSINADVTERLMALFEKEPTP